MDRVDHRLASLEQFVGRLRERCGRGNYQGYVLWSDLAGYLNGPCPQPPGDDALADAICSALEGASVGDVIRNPACWYVELGKAKAIVKGACK